MTPTALRCRLGTVILLVATTVAAACGSTVELSGSGAQSPGGEPDSRTVAFDDGLGMSALGAPDGTADDGMELDTSVPGGSAGGDAAPAGGSAGVPAGADGGTAPGGSTAGGSGAGSGGGSGGGASGGAGGSGSAPGLTANTIKIGFEYASDAQEANAALGEDVSPGNPRANYETLIKYYNERGGFAGRQIEPVWYEYSAFRDIGPQQQAACTHFTQDEPVFAVMVFLSQEPYINCLTKAGTGAWGTEALTGIDDDALAQYPGFALPSALSLTQVARLYGPGLHQAGFFEPEAVDKSTTIGLVTFDEPRYKKAAKVFEASLRSVGETLDEVQYVHYARTLDQAGQLSTEVSSAVLRFRREGVDHVTIIEASALIALSFQQAAEQQRYRPQYGFNSTSGGQAFINSGLSEPNQMVDARLVGWNPQFDVPARYVDKWPAQQECLRMYRRAGLNYPEGSNQRGVALLACAGFSFMKASLAAAPGPLTVASIQAGTDRLGTSWESPWNRVTRFGPGRHYGAALYLMARYGQDCNCFKPMGGLRRIP